MRVRTRYEELSERRPYLQVLKQANTQTILALCEKTCTDSWTTCMNFCTKKRPLKYLGATEKSWGRC